MGWGVWGSTRNLRTYLFENKNFTDQTPMGERYFSRRRRVSPNYRRYHRTKSWRPVVVRPTITMLSRARFGAVAHIRSFLYSKFVMTLVHLKIKKMQIERTRPIYGSDLVLTEWTPPRKSTHKMKNRSWVWWFLEVSTAFIFGLRRPHALRGWF